MKGSLCYADLLRADLPIDLLQARLKVEVSQALGANCRGGGASSIHATLYCMNGHGRMEPRLLL